VVDAGLPGHGPNGSRISGECQSAYDEHGIRMADHFWTALE